MQKKTKAFSQTEYIGLTARYDRVVATCYGDITWLHSIDIIVWEWRHQANVTVSNVICCRNTKDAKSYRGNNMIGPQIFCILKMFFVVVQLVWHEYEWMNEYMHDGAFLKAP